MMILRLSHVNLTDPVNDPENRYIDPMSTLIGTDDQVTWLLETTWDGSIIGDVQIYRNENALPNGQSKVDADGKKLAADWKWWSGVPRGKIRNYRFYDRSILKPGTVGELELPFIDGKRETKPGSTGKAAVRSTDSA
jgi:hypothetical protein